MKSLVFVADTEPVLVLTSGGNRVDVVKVGRRRSAATVRKADAEEVRAATGYAIGGTPPFGHARDLPVLVDRHLTGFEVVWAAAGTPPRLPDRPRRPGPRLRRRGRRRHAWGRRPTGGVAAAIMFWRDHANGKGARMSEVTQAGSVVALSETAATKVRDLLAREGRDDLALRVAVEPGGCSGLRYALFFDDRSLDGDVRGEVNGVAVVTDKMSAPTSAAPPSTTSTPSRSPASRSTTPTPPAPAPAASRSTNAPRGDRRRRGRLRLRRLRARGAAAGAARRPVRADHPRLPEQFAGRPLGLAVDLGCGTGHTTRLLARSWGRGAPSASTSRPRSSPGGGRAPAGVTFAVHDVRTVPFPTGGPSGLLFCRLLLSHLPDPAAALAAWATQLAPGGLLLVDEVERIHTADPALRGYLEVAGALLASRGQTLEVGPVLHRSARPGRAWPAATTGSPSWPHRPPPRPPCSPRTWPSGAARRSRTGSWPPRPCTPWPGTWTAVAEGGRPATITWELRQLAWEAARPR